MGDQKVFDDVRVGYSDEELVTNGEGEEVAVLLCPFVEGELGILRKVGKTA